MNSFKIKKAVSEKTAKNPNQVSSPFPYAGITQIRLEGIVSDIPKSKHGITPLTACKFIITKK